MTLKYVDSVPKLKPGDNQDRRLAYNKVMKIVDQFHNDPRKIAVIQCAECERYSSAKSLDATVRRAVKDRNYRIWVVKRGDEVYLVKD